MNREYSYICAPDSTVFRGPSPKSRFMVREKVRAGSNNKIITSQITSTPKVSRIASPGK